MPSALKVLLLSLAALGGSACDTQPALSGFAIGRDESTDTITIAYVGCDDVRVTEVMVVDPVEGLGGGDDRVLWHISSTGTADTTFEIGEVPRGFRLVKDFEELPDKELYYRIVNSQGIVVGDALLRSEIPTDGLVKPANDSAAVPLEEHLVEAAKRC